MKLHTNIKVGDKVRLIKSDKVLPLKGKGKYNVIGKVVRIQPENTYAYTVRINIKNNQFIGQQENTYNILEIQGTEFSNSNIILKRRKK